MRTLELHAASAGAMWATSTLCVYPARSEGPAAAYLLLVCGSLAVAAFFLLREPAVDRSWTERVVPSSAGIDTEGRHVLGMLKIPAGGLWVMTPGGDMRQSLARGGLAAAEVRGAAARARWIREGLVVPGAQLAKAWRITQETLATATASGEVVSIAVDGSVYVPKALLSEDRLTAGAICRALRHLQGTEKMMFWLRDHGALGGRNVGAALEAGTPTAKVTALAEAWARERTDLGGQKVDVVDGLEHRS